ncbi:MAG: hypothetical protein NVS2B4_00470 [Ramlibacter sp.]
MFQRLCFQNAMRGVTLLLCGCAFQAPVIHSQPIEDTRAALACTVPTQCVNSLEPGGLSPLRYEGTPVQAIAVLRTTLAEFPEAKIVSSDGLSIQAVFTTPLGFRDLVDFRIDPQAQRINYRSRSSFGLFDFGKNRSRMTAFAARFQLNAGR